MVEPTYLAPGVVLQDRYEIAQEIGRGGFSVVYRARDRRIGADVAIKLLVPPPAAARLARERLRREVQAVRQLSHPNIVPVYDVADEGAWSFVVMEYVPGLDLAVRVRQRGPLDAAATARLGREIAAALDAAHRRGMLHRDVKPQNILLAPAPDGRARLTDFGSARLSGLETVTQTGGLVGTVDYAAPELVAGGRGDGRADVYALGVTLYYALTGELPPRAASSLAVGARRAAGRPGEGHRPRQRRPDLPAWLDDVVQRATTPDPDDRFPSAGLLAAALELRGESPDPAPALPERERCVLCGAREPFGIGVCPRCARRGVEGDDVLVFLERTTPGPARRAVREALEDRIGAEATSGGRAAAAAGERPLMRVPAEAGVRVLELLEAHGLPARTERRAPPWQTDVPGSIVTLACVVAVGGDAAALAAATPVLLVTSPVVAGTLVALAGALRRTPVWNPPSRERSALSPEAARLAVRALAALPTGPARSLLVDLLRRANAVTGEGSVRLGPLVVAACAAARELAALEQHLAAFDARRDRLADAPPGWLDALSRCERGRDLLTQRLLEASAALSGWQARAAEGGAGGDALGVLARDLDEEGRRQEAAAREVAELLT